MVGVVREFGLWGRDARFGLLALRAIDPPGGVIRLGSHIVNQSYMTFISVK
jgi:hypothetical protein